MVAALFFGKMQSRRPRCLNKAAKSNQTRRDDDSSWPRKEQQRAFRTLRLQKQTANQRPAFFKRHSLQT
ncbi:MAG TPA: hypothetical protein DHV90_05230 [Lactobacillus sp.]|nr:hypothetical protein [Lactobacillus sp.]